MRCADSIPKLTKAALDTILRKLDDRHIAVLLAGMRAPRNMGADYVRDFDAIYPALASTYPVVFYPFFLDGVAADPKLNQGDGMHPNAAGVDVIVARILPRVEELISRARIARGIVAGSRAMPRLFTGVEIPSDVGQALGMCAAACRARAGLIRRIIT